VGCPHSCQKNKYGVPTTWVGGLKDFFKINSFGVPIKVNKKPFDNRVIHKVRKTKHQNPEFGHKQGEIH